VALKGAAIGALASIAVAGVAGQLIEATPAGAALSVHVVGNLLVDQNGATIRLLGVDRSGTEYMCVVANAIFDGPVDNAAIAAIKAWNTNVVRVPLNEDCWLGINLGSSDPAIGAPYRKAIRDFVSRLNRAGLYVILDLHWNAPAQQVADQQQPMADLDHGPAFWTSVAAIFKENPAVIFDLYNEPYVGSWSCWRDGCTVTTSDGTWKTAGMSMLLAAIRKAGATQPIMLGGLEYAEDLSEWLNYMPNDPLTGAGRNPVPGEAQLVASYHTYCGPPGTGTPAACRDWLPAVKGQWPAVVEVSKRAPVVTGEFGEYDCARTYTDRFMRFADHHGISYLGWAWDTHGCGSFPALISDYSGVPTPYGKGLMAHLAGLAQ
jgi:hypothetical protein